MEKSTQKVNGVPSPLRLFVSSGAELSAEQKALESVGWWDHPEFSDQLVRLLVFDKEACEYCVTECKLVPDDIKPLRGMKNGRERSIVSDRALECYGKYQKPLDSQAKGDVQGYIESLNTSDENDRIDKANNYIDHLAKLKPAPREYILAKVQQYKSQRFKAAAIRELNDLQAADLLTDEKWREISAKALAASKEPEPAPVGAQWPEKLSPDALYGLAGDVVRAIEPNTESDPAALLVQFLLVFGNVIGRHAHWKVESTRHYLNLFAVLVGATSKARKGTSLDRVLQLFEDLDADWFTKRRMGGLSTGEGLILEVRDPKLRLDKDGNPKRDKDKNLEFEDRGVEDKRLLIVEPEFARVLKVGDREAATLSPILRDAWDRGELRTMTKNDPLHATGVHVSVIGHITDNELKTTLSSTNRANGFANRFLWVCVRRSKALALGGRELAPNVRMRLVSRLRDAVEHAGRAREMKFGTKAVGLWKKAYPQLSEGYLGMLGAATDRAEAQVRRLACLYALLDGKALVCEEHLRAALEVWRYCMDSARFLFGVTSGDPIADAILKELRRRGKAGMSRNEIRTELFQQNKSSEAIGHALAGLQKTGLARTVPIPKEGAGRPTEQWYAV